MPAEGEIIALRLFGDDRPLHFEIGFGSGEHLANRADMLPDHGFIGAEPFLNGVATALGHIRDQHLANVRLWRGDALEVLQRVPDGALSFLYLLHPDPWPKARHAKRRMVNERPGRPVRRQVEAGRGIPARDRRPDLSQLGADGHAAPHRAVRLDGRRAGDFLEPSGGWIETRYGAKSRREGRRPYYLRYRRI